MHTSDTSDNFAIYMCPHRDTALRDDFSSAVAHHEEIVVTTHHTSSMASKNFKVKGRIKDSRAHISKQFPSIF